MSESDTSVTQLLKDSAQGHKDSTAKLLELLYDSLRGQAEQLFEGESPSHTLQPTALVHESFLRLIGQRDIEWKSRGHFLSVSAMMMRRILIDHARKKHRLKRGAAWKKIAELDDRQISIDNDDDVLSVHDALERLEKIDPRQAQIVEMRFFGGLTNEEVAKVLDVSLRTVEGEWAFARAWLRRELADE